MQYRIAPLFCRPWTLNGMSPRLIESHYEHNYGGTVVRLNAITEELAALDPATTPADAIGRLKRDQLGALNSTLLHELYFASLGGDGRAVPEAMASALVRDFGSVDRWRREFVALAGGLAGGSGWVLLELRPARRLPRQSRWRRSQPDHRRRDPDPRPRHVRARLSARLWGERDRLCGDVHAQHRLGGGAGTLRGRDKGPRRRGRWSRRNSPTCPPSRSRS